MTLTIYPFDASAKDSLHRMFCACLLLAALSAHALIALDIKIPDFSAVPAEAGPEIRIADELGTVLLSHQGRVIAGLRIRERNAASAETPVLSLEAARAALANPTILRVLKEHVKEFDFSREGAPAGPGVLLQTRAVAQGARLLLTNAPGRIGRIGPANSRRAEPAALEIALQIFPDANGNVLNLTYLDGDAAAEKYTRAATLRARALTFEIPKKQRLTLERSAPAEWAVKRAGNSILLTAPLARDPHAPEKFGSFVLFIGAAHDEDAPETSAIHLNKTQLPAREFVEGWARVYTAGANPYLLQEAAVVAEIALPPRPDGTVPTRLIPCYFWEAPNPGEQEPEFRFRFAPPAEGLYGVRLYVTTPANKCNSDTEAFRAGVPAGPGSARVRKGERVFRLEDGTLHTPVGLDLSAYGTAEGLDFFVDKFIELERCGGNTVALTLSRLLPLEGPEAGRFDPRTAELLDGVFFAAQARGIGIVLALENGPDIGRNSAQHPYFREMGGPLIAQPEFFRAPAAKRFFQARLAYAAARYSAFRSLLAWDLIRDLDETWPALKKDPEDKTLGLIPREIDLSRRLRRDVEDWVEQMSQQLRGLDAHGHPIGVTTALEPEKSWLGLLEIEHLEWLGARDFAGAGARDIEEKYPALNLNIGQWAAEMRGPKRAKKPWGVLVFGARQSSGAPQLASIVAGLPFAPLLMSDAKNPLSEDERASLRAASIFGAALAEISSFDTKDELPALTVASANGPAKLFGRASKRGLAAWILNPGATAGLEFKLPGLLEGHYSITWMDARSGLILSSQPFDAPAQQVNQALEPWMLKTPGFEGELAVFVVRQAKGLKNN